MASTTIPGRLEWGASRRPLRQPPQRRETIASDPNVAESDSIFAAEGFRAFIVDLRQSVDIAGTDATAPATAGTRLKKEIRRSEINRFM